MSYIVMRDDVGSLVGGVGHGDSGGGDYGGGASGNDDDAWR